MKFRTKKFFEQFSQRSIKDFRQNGKKSKKFFRFNFLRKSKTSKDKKSRHLIVSSPPKIEDLQNEFMIRLRSIHRRRRRISNDEQTRQFISTRSADNLHRCSIQFLLKVSKSVQPLPQLFSTEPRRRITKSNLSLISVSKKSSSFKSICSNDQPAIISVSHQPLSMLAVRQLEKSYSSPLPINQNYSTYHEQNIIHSAHLIGPYSSEQKSSNTSQPSTTTTITSTKTTTTTTTALMSSSNSTTDTSSSNDESQIERTLLNNQSHFNKTSLYHRWSFADLWKNTLSKIPSMWNYVSKQRVHRTGSREFLLECEQIVPVENHAHNNSSHAKIFRREERYVEQERPIDSHIGLAIFALMIFPPVGIFAVILSIWSFCGQQDRHLSRKFGNATYWTSLLAISLSFLLLLTLLSYFTYEYLINHSDQHNTYDINHPHHKTSIRVLDQN